jgi:Tfp pilus assembly PilM family ATPase
LTRLTLSAVQATLDGSGVRVKAALHCDVPAELNTENVEEMGRWVAQTLNRAGLSSKRALLVVPRSSVVLKRLSLPRPEQRADLPDLVRLAMTRQLAFGAQDAVVDYLELDETEGATGAELSVLAAAMSGDLLNWYLQVARAAALKPARVALRSSGLAALLTTAHVESPPKKKTAKVANAQPAEAQAPAGPELMLATEVDKREIGMIVLSGEELIFARATELDRNHDAETEDERLDAYAGAVATEVRRTWMSYRVTIDAGDIKRAVVIGEHVLAQRAATRIEESIGVPARVFDVHPQIHADEDLPAGVWPLAGSLLQLWSGLPAVNFAKPRRAPDRQAALRQRILLAIAALIIIVGSAETIIRKNLGVLRDDQDAVLRQARQLGGEAVTLLRQEARLRHLQTWEETRVDWLAHLSHLTNRLPDTTQATLNGFGGRAEAAVAFERDAGETNYADGTWQPRVLLDINLSGQAVSRDVADEVRGIFVEDPLYRCEPLGSDTGGKGGERQPAKFGVKLLTTRATPVDEPAESDEQEDDQTTTARGEAAAGGEAS